MVLEAPHTLDNLPPETDTERGLVWHDARALGVGGKAWADTARFYDRLPARAEAMIPEGPWLMSRHSAGLYVGFRTDATAIHARWTLGCEQLEGDCMCRAGMSGLDLYAEDADGHWRWLSFGSPTGMETQDSQLAGDIPAGSRGYLLYLPLFNNVLSLQIGVPAGAAIEGIVPFTGGQVVYYGTSIVHGYSASRPGMCHAAQLGRWLNRPLLNLGLAGVARMEPGMAELLAELDPAVYVLDTLPNMDAAQITERAEPFIRRLRQAHPTTPIVLVEDRSYGNAWLLPGPRERNLTSRAAFRAVFERLQADNMADLYYLPGEALLGEDDDATADSSHPNDLGYFRMANALYPLLAQLI